MLKISGIPKADHPFFVKEVCIGKGSEASFIRGEARSDSGRLVVGLSHLASVNFAEQYSSLKFFLIDRFLFAETLYVNHPMEFFECSIGCEVTIGAGSEIKKCQIGEKSNIGEKCKLKSSTIGKGVKIGNGVNLFCASIGDASSVSAGVCLWGSEIGKGVYIEDGFHLVLNDKGIVIEDGVKIGKNVRVLSPYKVTIGLSAVIEDNALVLRNIPAGATLHAVDSPNPEALYQGSYECFYVDSFSPNKVFSKPFQTFLKELGYANKGEMPVNCSKGAVSIIENNLLFALLPFIYLDIKEQLVKISIGEHSIVIYHQTSGWGEYFFYSPDEIPEAYIKEERNVQEEDICRLSRLREEISRIAYKTKKGREDQHFGTNKYVQSNALRLFSFMHLLFSNREIDQWRCLDIGSGKGVAVDIIGLFMESHGIEKREALHKIAEAHLDKRKNIRLFNGDFFEHDISGYNIVHLYLGFPFEETEMGISFKSEFAERLNRKLQELPSGSLIIMAPVDFDSDWGSGAWTRQAAAEIFEGEELKRVELNLPKLFWDYEIYRRK